MVRVVFCWNLDSGLEIEHNPCEALSLAFSCRTPIGQHRRPRVGPTDSVKAESDRVACLCPSATVQICSPRMSRAAGPDVVSGWRQSNLEPANAQKPVRTRAGVVGYGHNKIKMIQRNRIIYVQRNSINTAQHNPIMEPEARRNRPWPDPTKNSHSPSKSCEASRLRKARGRSGRATCHARTGSASCVTASCRKSSRAGIFRAARTK
jgi:hypothetical protein